MIYWDCFLNREGEPKWLKDCGASKMKAIEKQSKDRQSGDEFSSKKFKTAQGPFYFAYWISAGNLHSPIGGVDLSVAQVDPK